jgi:hypothetical protein
LPHSIRASVGAAFVALSLFLPSAPGIAQDTGVIYAGGEIGEGHNVYAGAVVALPGSRLGQGLAVRAGGSAGEYEYRSGIGLVEGDYVSGEAALVYQTSGQWGWANFGAGPRVTETTLKPADPGNDLAGTRWDLAVQADGVVGNRWRLGWFGSLGVFDQTYITQLRFGPLVDEPSQTRVGVEAGLQGDNSYTRGSLGVFLSSRIADKTEARISGGFSEQRGRGAKPYGGIALSRTF